MLIGEIKISFSILTQWLREILHQNAYIDTALQKGGISGMPDRLEHMAGFTQLVREAQVGKAECGVVASG